MNNQSSRFLGQVLALLLIVILAAACGQPTMVSSPAERPVPEVETIRTVTIPSLRLTPLAPTGVATVAFPDLSVRATDFAPTITAIQTAFPGLSPLVRLDDSGTVQPAFADDFALKPDGATFFLDEGQEASAAEDYIEGLSDLLAIYASEGDCPTFDVALTSTGDIELTMQRPNSSDPARPEAVEAVLRWLACPECRVPAPPECWGPGPIPNPIPIPGSASKATLTPTPTAIP